MSTTNKFPPLADFGFVSTCSKSKILFHWQKLSFCLHVLSLKGSLSGRFLVCAHASTCLQSGKFPYLAGFQFLCLHVYNHKATFSAIGFVTTYLHVCKQKIPLSGRFSVCVYNQKVPFPSRFCVNLLTIEDSISYVHKEYTDEQK